MKLNTDTGLDKKRYVRTLLRIKSRCSYFSKCDINQSIQILWHYPLKFLVKSNMRWNTYAKHHIGQAAHGFISCLFANYILNSLNMITGKLSSSCFEKSVSVINYCFFLPLVRLEKQKDSKSIFQSIPGLLATTKYPQNVSNHSIMQNIYINTHIIALIVYNTYNLRVFNICINKTGDWRWFQNILFFPIYIHSRHNLTFQLKHSAETE